MFSKRESGGRGEHVHKVRMCLSPIELHRGYDGCGLMDEGEW